MKRNLIFKSAVSLSLLLGVSNTCSALDVVETKMSAVLTSGVTVSTSASGRDNPQPILMHIVDNGNLPPAGRPHLKGASMLGSCYGDLPSKRVVCRIHALSLVDPLGHSVEKSVEGWIIGEDGTPGLQGKAVDRIGKEERDVFVEEITNDIKKVDVLENATSQGGTNALEKLSAIGGKIKRAEAMSPVLLVEAGRDVTVIFKKESDLNIAPQAGNLINETSQALSKGSKI